MPDPFNNNPFDHLASKPTPVDPTDTPSAEDIQAKAELEAELAAIESQTHNEALADKQANLQGQDTKPIESTFARVGGVSFSDPPKSIEPDSKTLTPTPPVPLAPLGELNPADVASPMFGIGTAGDKQSALLDSAVAAATTGLVAEYELRFRVDRDTHLAVQQASVCKPANEAEAAQALDQRLLDLVVQGKVYLKVSPSPGGREVGKWFVARLGLPVSAVESEDSWQAALDNVEPFVLPKVKS